MSSKADLRRKMRGRLRELDERTRVSLSRKIGDALMAREDFQRATTIGAFAAMASEPNLANLLGTLPKRFAFPRIVDGKLQLYTLESLSELTHSHPELPFCEPPLIPARRVRLREVELMLVPGLAFTADGRRLGRGGGYYDRLLASAQPGTIRIGVCFPFQLVDDIPTEPHDEHVHAVVTGAQ